MTEDRQQRRLSTILAADVFGYSRLTAENEEETFRTLKAHRGIIDRLIARHEGRIFNTAGDSVIAEFGSAVEAVRCAITIQEELRVRNANIDENRRMLFRIGINVGDVLVDGDNLYGDGVNIAARLESIAAPGNICISGSIFELVKSKLSYGFEDIGLQSMKNIPEPVPAFRLTAEPNVHRRPTNRRPLIIASALAVLSLSAFALWMGKSGIFRETTVAASTVSSNVTGERKSAPPATYRAAPNAVTTAFDGIWEFTLTGGQYCPIKTLVFHRKIQSGFVLSNDGDKIGSVDANGTMQFSNPSPVNPNIEVRSQATVAEEKGEGSYLGVGTPCQGTYQIRLVQRF